MSEHKKILTVLHLARPFDKKIDFPLGFNTIPVCKKIPEIEEVVQIVDEEEGLDLTEENIEATLDEIRPYLAGTGGGELELVEVDAPIVKVKLTGPAAKVMTVRVAVTQKLREKIPSIAAVQLI